MLSTQYYSVFCSATFLLFIRFKGSVLSLSPALCIRNSQFGSAMRPLRSTLVSSLRVARRELASDTKSSQLKIKKYLLSMLVRLSLFHFPSSHIIQPDMVPTSPRLFLNTHIDCKTLFHYSLCARPFFSGPSTRRCMVFTPGLLLIRKCHTKIYK